MKFKVGDVCEIIKAEVELQMVGCECTIVGGPEPCFGNEYIGWVIEVPKFRSRHPSGDWCARPEFLRLKRPPSWNKWLYDTRDVEPEITLEVSNDGGKTFKVIS